MIQEKNTPSGEWGTVFHLQDIIAFTNGESITGNLESYALGLITWHIEVNPIIFNKNQIKSYSNFLGEIRQSSQIVSDEEIIKLTKLYLEIEEELEKNKINAKNLRQFHLMLNYLTHKCDLRLKVHDNKNYIPEALK